MLLRDMGIPGYLRATIGTDAENDVLIKVSADRQGERMSRRARIERTTSESTVLVDLDLDGTGQVEISTGVRFYDHMLISFGVHGCST